MKHPGLTVDQIECQKCHFTPAPLQKIKIWKFEMKLDLRIQVPLYSLHPIENGKLAFSAKITKGHFSASRRPESVSHLPFRFFCDPLLKRHYLGQQKPSCNQSEITGIINNWGNIQPYNICILFLKIDYNFHNIAGKVTVESQIQT